MLRTFGDDPVVALSCSLDDAAENFQMVFSAVLAFLSLPPRCIDLIQKFELRTPRTALAHVHALGTPRSTNQSVRMGLSHSSAVSAEQKMHTHAFVSRSPWVTPLLGRIWAPAMGAARLARERCRIPRR